MAEQFLNDTQIGAALEQVGRRAVPQTVRSDVMRSVHRCDGLVHDSAGLPRVQPSTAGAEQQRRPRLCGGQRRAAVAKPGPQRVQCRLSERHGALLVAFSEHPQQSVPGVEVVDVEAAQLTHPDSSGVQQLHDQPISQRQRITLLGTGIRSVHGGQSLVLA